MHAGVLVRERDGSAEIGRVVKEPCYESCFESYSGIRIQQCPWQVASANISGVAGEDRRTSRRESRGQVSVHHAVAQSRAHGLLTLFQVGVRAAIRGQDKDGTRRTAARRMRRPRAAGRRGDPCLQCLLHRSPTVVVGLMFLAGWRCTVNSCGRPVISGFQQIL